MPSAFKSQPMSTLNLGVNLRGLTGGVNQIPGEAQDALDMHILEDGSIEKHWGWERVNPSALTGRPVGMVGFTYKGKNNAVTGASDTARGGNYGIADDGNDFTRRGTLYTGALVLTDSTFYRWEPATQDFQTVSLPTSHTVSLHPKPTFVTYNNNIYICGYTTSTTSGGNLRYDPVDEALYAWGWEKTPTAPTVAASAGGDLRVGSQYKYAYSWLDVYTGEESPITEVASQPTIAGSNQTITVTMTPYSEATEGRHFNTLAVATDSDVGYIVYRSDADREQYNFLATVAPGNTDGAASAPGFVDTGFATEASIHPYIIAELDGSPIAGNSDIPDEPDFNFMTLFKDQFYAVSYAAGASDRGRPTNSNRVWWNDFRHENSFVERWRHSDYRELPLPEGEILTSVAASNTHLIPFTQKGAYGMSVTPNYASGKISRVSNRLPWNVGCVGAKAWATTNGWLYFLSERGPYRYKSGTGEPQWIGKNLLPMFMDTSGICQLNPGMQSEAEVVYDQQANSMRFMFACGPSDVLNRHITYWVDGDKYLPRPEYGWIFASPKAQCAAQILALSGLDPSGAPPDPTKRQERLVFGDDLGYINSYELTSMRAGLPSGSIARGSVISATPTTVTVTVAADPLLTQGDGLKGMNLEVVHSNGVIETFLIASNTATVITTEGTFDTTPTSADTWYVSGIPAFWRSWVDSMGKPHNRKTLLHLYATYTLTDIGGNNSATIDVAVHSGDRNMDKVRTRTAALNDYNEKMLISRTGLYFTYEFANTRPDEMFTLVAIEPEARLLGDKRKE